MTAKQIDKMEIEEIEQLANNLSAAELELWADWGYDGRTYVQIINARERNESLTK